MIDGNEPLSVAGAVMMPRCRISILIFTLLSAVLAVPSPAAPAERAVTVLPIEESALDKLVADTDAVLVVSFMAAWCGPCIDELPLLNKLYRKYRGRGLRMVGISIDPGGPEKIQALVRSARVKFPVYWFGEKAVDKYGLTAIPMLLIIRGGRIDERLPGQRSEKFLDEKFRQILGLN